MFQDWLQLYKKIHSAAFQKEDLACPECLSRSVDFQYVGDASRRIGYLDIWCTTCWKGVHFSRVSIPADRDMISFDAPDEVLTARIPEFEQVDNSEAEK